ncbi:MAG TPA: AGE family epimerase/isomerase [Opitutaceae bacterium]|nr:AGE family epimerase/isomerase [Opitutaceae bacterium]
MRRSLFVFATTAGLFLPFEASTCGAPTGSREPAAALVPPAAGALGVAEREQLRDLARRAESELRTNILPFWLKHARDRERGGFYGVIERDLKVRKDAPRGALLTARILWTFSAAHRRYQDPEYLKMAAWAYDDLLKRFWDAEHGGVRWTVKANGKPLEQRKQIYAQAFALYGLVEYHRATGDPVARDRAAAVFRLIEEHAYDREQGGYFEAFTRDWAALPEGTRSLMDTAEPKSQNTMLHIMEAYTNLYRVWPDDLLRRRLAELVDRMMTRVLDPNTKHLHLLLAADWSPRSQRISYGHDIEFSWLLTEAAAVLGDPSLRERVRPLAVEIAQVVRAEGLDADGGLHNEGGPEGLLDASKDWWPQAEATVGFLNAYQLSGEASHLRAAGRSWDFIEQRIVDRENGEWFWGRDPRGRVIARQPKAGLWKCPYHNGRACLELIERAEQLLGAGAAD